MVVTVGISGRVRNTRDCCRGCRRAGGGCRAAGALAASGRQAGGG